MQNKRKKMDEVKKNDDIVVLSDEIFSSDQQNTSEDKKSFIPVYQMQFPQLANCSIICSDNVEINVKKGFLQKWARS